MISVFFLILIFAGESFSAADDSVHTKKLFKIGFEFQEVSHLCPWALVQLDCQKKEIFYVNWNEAKLWSVVIDGRDIEFVTEPFGNDQKVFMSQAVDGICKACDVLLSFKQERLSGLGAIGLLTFQDWLNGIPNCNLSDKICGLFDKFGCDLETTDIYHQIKNQHLDIKKEFSIKFQPQMTLQLPIEKLLTVITHLYGGTNLSEHDSLMSYFRSQEKKSSNLLISDMSVFFENINDEIMDSSKEFSFLGIFALHMIQLTKMISIEDTEEQRLRKLYVDYLTYQQMNAKRDLAIISRRPFSDMWEDINSDAPFVEYIQSLKYSFIDEMQLKMACLNYGKKYRRPDGSAIRLNYMCEKLGSDYSNAMPYKYFLDNGMVTTGLMRFIDYKEYFSNYLTDIISSIDDPSKSSKPFLKIENGQLNEISMESSNYDLLSPPIFLPETDSMGNYKTLEIDRNYGEGIFEFRNIKDIGPYAIKMFWMRNTLKINSEHFLTSYECVFEERNALLDGVNGIVLLIENVIKEGIV